MSVDLSHLNTLYTEARKVKDVIAADGDWGSASDMIRGNQLPPRLPKHKPRAVLNMLRPLAERKMAMLTDTKPRFNVVPSRSGDGYAKAAAILDETCNAWWDDQCIDQRLVRGVNYAQTLGSMVVKTVWSTVNREIDLVVVDPRNFYIDPYLVSPSQLHEASYVIEEEYPALDDIKARFPAHAKELKQWASLQRDTSESGILSRIAKVLTTPFSKERDKSTAVPRAYLRHYWLADYTTEELEVVKDGKKFDVHRRKYPGGRYVLWAYGGDTKKADEGGVILHDAPNPYWDLMHPYDMMDWYSVIDGPWGDSEVFAHKHTQILLNKLAEVLAENAMLMNNPIWVCDQNAFPADEGPKGWGQLTNAAGNIVRKRPGTEVRRDYPQGIPSSILQFAQHIENFIESRAGGFPESMTGKKVGQLQSGLGIEQLQQAGSALIRLKARALENLIQRVGQKCISRVIQFYPEERMFHMLDPGSEEFKQFIFKRQDFRNALSPQVLQDAHRDFRFKVVPGSSLSMTRIQKGIMAVQLRQMGLLSGESVLHAVEWPDAKGEYKKALEELMAMAAAGVPPGGAKGGKSKRGYQGMERQQKIAGRI